MNLARKLSDTELDHSPKIIEHQGEKFLVIDFPDQRQPVQAPPPPEGAYVKAMSKAQLADHFGVTPRTLLNWFNRIEPQLKELGYYKHMKVLTPKLTRFVLGWFG